MDTNANMPQAPAAFTEALKQYPILGTIGVTARSAPPSGDNLLEFWPPGETGDKAAPRPDDVPLDKPGMTIYSDKVRPIDVLGDVVSHYLVNTDPKIKGYYDNFAKSITPQQEQMLQQQYAWSVKNEGETRPYVEWRQTTGLPAAFRGYAFKQWPDDFNAKVYTDQQRAMFDRMMQDLSAPQPAPAPSPSDVYQKNTSNKAAVQQLRGTNAAAGP